MDPAPLSTRIEALGDAALVIHFGERIDPLVNAHVLASAERLRAAAWPGIVRNARVLLALREWGQTPFPVDSRQGPAGWL